MDRRTTYLWGTILLLVLVAGGCASAFRGYGVHSSVDEFTGAAYDLMDNNVLGGGGFADARVELNPQRFTPKGGSPTYQVFVQYEWSSWMFIEDGPSLVFLIDGERVEVRGPGSRGDRDVWEGGKVRETAMYQVSFALLERLAEGSEVKVRVVGSEFNMDREFTATNFERFRDFVTRYPPSGMN